MAKSSAGKRIVLQLDRRMVFEALILNRLERMPERRRQEWLRTLLVQGFCDECQSLRVAQDDLDPRPIKSSLRQSESTRHQPSAFAAWLAKPAAQPGITTRAVTGANTHAVALGQDKPFAGLRKVIG